MVIRLYCCVCFLRLCWDFRHACDATKYWRKKQDSTIEKQLGNLILAQKDPYIHVKNCLRPNTVYIKHLYSLAKIGFIIMLMEFPALYCMYVQWKSNSEWLVGRRNFFLKLTLRLLTAFTTNAFWNSLGSHLLRKTSIFSFFKAVVLGLFWLLSLSLKRRRTSSMSTGGLYKVPNVGKAKISHWSGPPLYQNNG